MITANATKMKNGAQMVRHMRTVAGKGRVGKQVVQAHTEKLHSIEDVFGTEVEAKPRWLAKLNPLAAPSGNSFTKPGKKAPGLGKAAGGKSGKKAASSGSAPSLGKVVGYGAGGVLAGGLLVQGVIALVTFLLSILTWILVGLGALAGIALGIFALIQYGKRMDGVIQTPREDLAPTDAEDQDIDPQPEPQPG